MVLKMKKGHQKMVYKDNSKPFKTGIGSLQLMIIGLYSSTKKAWGGIKFHCDYRIMPHRVCNYHEEHIIACTFENCPYIKKAVQTARETK